MSRNVRQKNPPAPPKATKRRGSSSSSSPSDDEGYSAVEDISDSEDDDEEGVNAAEEEHIIRYVLQKGRTAGSPRPDLDDENDDADEEDDDDDDEDNDEEGLLPDENDADQSSSWNGFMSDADDSAAAISGSHHSASPVKRQVRFTGVPDIDSDSTTSDTTDDVAEFFPDIFVEQTSLDPAFRREIEQDDGSSNDSYWDFYESCRAIDTSHMDAHVDLSSDDDLLNTGLTTNQTPTKTLAPTQAGDNPDDDDGYDTDGDTTEEDVPEPLPRRKQHRRVSPAAETSDSDTDRPIRVRQGRPRVGHFDLDGTDVKPVAVLHPGSRKMIIFTPEKSRDFDLSPESFRGVQCLLPFNSTELSPIASHSGSLMMAAMLSSQTFGDLVNSLPFGPEEAFLPLVSSDTAMVDDSDFSGMCDREDEAEKSLQIEDFIQFNEDSSDEEGETQEDNGTPNWTDDIDTDLTPTPGRRPSTAASMSSETNLDMHPLLTHFDNNPEAVSAFRMNQANQQLILSEKASSESLAFSGPYTIGTLKGIKSGSLGTVAAPITPVRRQKRGSMNGTHDYDRSPTETVLQKRKASAAAPEGSHKRHRSISDVRSIAL